MDETGSASGDQEDEPAEYLAERLREAIATEPEVHELGIVVRVTGRSVLLSGSASTPAQRDAITRLVQRLAPDHEVVNEVDVPPMSPPGGVEELR
jgi:osmotically-inducible protein OsmY